MSLPDIGGIIETTHQRMLDAAKAKPARQLFDSIILENSPNIIGAYKDTGKSFFGRRLLYHLATDARTPGVHHELGEGEHLQCTFIDPEQRQANLRYWVNWHNRLDPAVQMQADRNIIEIRSFDGFTTDIDAFLDTVKRHVDKGKHLDFCYSDSVGMLWGRGAQIQQSSQMDLMVEQIFKELSAFKTVCFSWHIVKGEELQKRDKVPALEGSTHLENMIQGNIIYMGAPIRDPRHKRIFVHRAIKDEVGKTTYREHEPPFVLDIRVDERTPYRKSHEIMTYEEWQTKPQDGDDDRTVMWQMWDSGSDLQTAAERLSELRNIKVDSAKKLLRTWQIDFTVPTEKRDRNALKNGK